MCRSAKLSMLFVLLLIVALTACAPAATPVPPTATNPPPPTNTPVPPTATLTLAPTDAPKAPTPGPLTGKFDAGGVNLFLVCLGGGSPTVVLDAGWGMDSNAWLKVTSALRSHTRVCAYDRASVGGSDKQPGLRTSGQMAEQLHTLLASAGVKGPYIPVGHSLGGMNMLLFANRYPSEVAGLVLVDSEHPDQADRLSAVLPTPAPKESEALASLRKDTVDANPDDPNFPEPMNWAETLAQVRAVKSLGSLPLVVLVRGPNNPSIHAKWTQWYPGLPDDLIAKQEQVWLDLHKELAALSSDSQLILAEHSGHVIQEDEPQLVIDAILNLVDKARQK